MKITELLSRNSILLGAAPKSKDEAIDTLVDLMEKGDKLNDREGYKKGVLEREASGTTGIGEGIAIPHAKVAAVKYPGLSSMTVPEGVDYESLDGEPSKLFFMIAAPAEGGDVHIEVLQRLSMLLMNENFRNDLLNAKDVDTYLDIIDKAEREKFAEEYADEKPVTQSTGGYDVLAVTACPTGIAHTFMAAENLATKGKEKGISIKVETNGSGGAKNVLTPEEIKNAKCIIVAADKKVEMTRFNGKKVIVTKVADGIHKADELLDKAMAGDAPIFYAEAGAEEQKQEKGKGLHTIYVDLMNGVSNMLPFVIGGGILIALAFLFDNYEINPANFGSNTPFAAFLKQVGDSAFAFMLPVLAGFIASSIGDRPALAVGFVGGYLAKEGGSGFLGALAAGFIAGYLILALKKAFDKLPQSLEGIKPVLLYPLCGILLIGAIIIFIINPIVGAINTALFNGLNSMGSSSKILLGVILAGMMSIDMGGPINKAAYVFGTASITEGNYEMMAAVMIGGMVPPLAIALATTFFKNRFTEAERKSGVVNYIMGLSFITEGAIPFAASDPLHVIPACAIGAAISGGLSMFFNCTLMAPHGGLFVLPVIGNSIMYLLSLIIGSVVGTILLAILKKPIQN
ncbi:MAG: PTS transporter subunit EIIA [Firmicutes bacterium]|nr:PTS transporter subunit EIIA [Bacillota bacterium]